MSEPKTGDAWEDFCDELKEAGRAVKEKVAGKDERVLAEGYRHLVRMIRAGFEVTSEFTDPEHRHAELFPMASRTLLTEGVTSDARYHQAYIDGRGRYIIRGQRGTAPLIEIAVYSGRRGFHPTADRIGGLTESDLQVDANGQFEIHLSPQSPENSSKPGNWIQTNAECRYLFIREYTHDWQTTTEGKFNLSCEGVDSPRSPLELDELETALERTARFVREAPLFWSNISDYWENHALNQVVAQEEADSKTDIVVPTGHRFACGYFKLAADEALLVRFQPCEAAYWGIHLDNYWYETLSWDNDRSQLNDQSVTLEADGTVRLVISEQEPRNERNWLETQGHSEGSIVFRLSRSSAPMPVFETEVVPIDQL